MSYTQEVTISASPAKIFTAITQHVQQWWGYTDKPVSKVGEEFTTKFDQAFWKFKIVELVPNTKIVWECIDARHVHKGYEDIEREWVGTTVYWSIESISKTESKLSFRHDGLSPDLNCYEICTPAWDMFVAQSLKKYVEVGEGMPYLA